MKTFIQELVGSAPVLSDGAWGTQLQLQGLKPGACPDSWNLLYPERVEAIARAYVEAGSQVILTNTFGANAVALAHYSVADKAEEINRAGVEISRRAAGGRAFVFASMGPCGKLLISGEVTEKEMRAAFEQQARALASAGPNAIVIETMSDPDEAKLAIASALPTGLPIVASMTFESGRDHDRTMMGTTPEEAVKELAAAGADAIGANCGQGAEGYLPICKRLRAATNLPIWIKPNAGLPEVTPSGVQYRATPESFASHMQAIAEAGASFVGGCCGTTPEFIRALAGALPGKKNA